ncbi:MAG: ABC transporter ATP-binding protein [Bacteroidales bacterium]
MTAIRIEQLIKKYRQQTALNIDHLEIETGTLTGIVGNNGAGKTTLFRLILDLVEPTGGQALIEEKPVAGNDHWKSFTGSYLDEGFLIDFLTPEEYFYFVGKLHGMDPGAVDEKLKVFTRFISDEVIGQKKYIRQLSTGNKQKVGIVAAMLVQPRLLILDEPFNYLDPSSQIMVKRLLKADNESRETTMLVSSHNLNHLTDICSRVILLEKGRIIKDLTPPQDDLREVEQYFSVQAEDQGSKQAGNQNLTPR